MSAELSSVCMCCW